MAVPQTAQLTPYVPLVVLDWLRESPDARRRKLDGTLAFVDVSGFTSMSERLARKGRLGAEEVTEVMNATFSRLLAVAYEYGGALLKFGGDALLLFFWEEEHARRACRAAYGMRRTLRELGRPETSAGRVTLRMHAGVHSGPCHFFLVGDTHRELIVTGPSATRAVEMEASAEAGEIVVSEATAAALASRDLGGTRDGGRLLRAEPAAEPRPNVGPVPELAEEELVACVPASVRAHLASAAAEGEHRTATVAFLRFGGADGLLATEGSAALAAALDELVSCVQRAAAEHDVTFLETDIDRDGGRIVLVAGAPQTSGDDEERMLRTLRAVVEARPRLGVRIGVHRGHVFAGEVGPPFRRTYTILGDTAALAARLMARAASGEILSTVAVLERSRAAFETEELEPLAVKGKAKPVVARRVGPLAGARREAPERRRLPLVDRQRELAVLTAALQPARMGFGTLVELVGDPGIGKSRLVEEVEAMCVDMASLAAECEPYESSTAYGPFHDLLRSALGIEPAMDGDRLRARLEEVAPELLPWLPLLAIPLDLDVLPTREVEELDPSFRRARLHGVVSTLLGKLLASPTLLLFEDVHWMDEASSKLLRHLGSELSSRPWFTCVTRRPVSGGFSASEGVPPVPALTLRLEPLPAEDAKALVAAAARDELRQHEVAAVVERAGGNPLFLQELVAAARGEAEVEELPENVEALIAARVDRLAPGDRALLRWASVLGPSFTADLIEEVLEADPQATLDPESWDRLAELVERDPYVAKGLRFRHALIRDVAYEGLPFRRRRELHARVGEVYERRAGDDPGEVAELLSLHFHRAGAHEQAWRYSLLAGERAQSRYANVEAAEFYRRALDAARRLPELEPGRVAAVRESLGDVCELAGLYTDAADAYRDARRLAGERPGLLLKEGVIRERLGRYAEALRWYRRGLEAAEALPDERERVRQRIQLSLAYAGVRFRLGAFSECVEWCRGVVEDALAADEREGLAHAYYLLHLAYTSLGAPERAAFRGLALPIYEELGDLLGQANVLNNLGIDAYYEGRWDDALSLYERSKSFRERIGDVVGAATITSNIAEIRSDRGQLEEAVPLFQEAHDVCSAAGYRFVAALARSNLGRAAARAGRLEEAEELLREALEGFREIKAASFVLETEARLAERAVLAGDHAAALGQLAETEPRAGEAGPVLRALLLRLRGYALAQAGELEAARASLEESVRVAREAEAPYELALALEALARLADRTSDPTGPDYAAESGSLLDRLGVVLTPVVPLP